jgi:hypothetical protein
LAQLAGQDKDQAWHFLAIDDTWQDQYFLADNKVKSPKLGLSLSAIPASDLLPTPNDSGSVRPRCERRRAAPRRPSVRTRRRRTPANRARRSTS